MAIGNDKEISKPVLVKLMKMRVKVLRGEATQAARVRHYAAALDKQNQQRALTELLGLLDGNMLPGEYVSGRRI